MQHQEITFLFKGRYFKIGQLSPQTKQVWFVLHGYGQLAQYFIRKFNSLEGQHICVIAPEGLSNFYVEDVASRAQSGNNRVGASWMTRENRLTDVANYLEYLNAVYAHELRDHATVPVTVLGFSQGAATASRWVVDGKIRFDRLVLWAGILPPDMNLAGVQQSLAGKKVVFIYGTNDPFLTDERFTEMKTLVSTFGLSPEYLAFDGGHELHTPTLHSLL